MPHAIESALPKASGRLLQQLRHSYDEARALLNRSSISSSIPNILPSKGRPPITKIVSLGLGTFTTKNQSRVLKQLAFLLAIAEQNNPTSSAGLVEIYAQDPTFTRTDEIFLKSLGIKILRTPSSSDLGEAGKIIDRSTLVYSPFLTIDAYKLLFRACTVEYLVGDDFNALRVKWPKQSAERSEVERLVKGEVSKLRRRALGAAPGEFWAAEDKPFPMAIYWRQSERVEQLQGIGQSAHGGRSRKTLERL